VKNKKYMLNIEYIDYGLEENDTLNEKNKSTKRILIKKSLFLGTAYNIKNEEDVNKILKVLKKSHMDAKQTVYAYIIEGKGKFSDDGEPKGTAGKPIYKILEREKVVNTLIVVIRYFGGILLGKGVLARTYAKTAKETILMYDKIQKMKIQKMNFTYTYQQEKEILRLIKKTGAKVIKLVREEKNQILLDVPEDETKFFDKYLEK